MQAPQARTTTQGIELTPSVASVVDGLSGDVSSWQIVDKLLELHGEYGRNRGKDIRQQEGPKGKHQHVARWLDEVGALFDPSLVPSLHGRLVILGLCRLESEKELAEHLRGSGFLAAMQDELREDFLSLLTKEAAGVEDAYRGEFIRILQNRGKRQTGLEVQRSNGFLIIAKTGRRLDKLAELTQRQTYNRCYTARYVLPSGAPLAHGLRTFAYDLVSLETDSGTIEGDLLPDPVTSHGSWKPLLKGPVKEALAEITRIQTPPPGLDLEGKTSYPRPGLANVASLKTLVEAFAQEDVLGVGLRLVLLFEFRGVRVSAAPGLSPPVAPEDVVFGSEVASLLEQLPERVGFAFSGLPDDFTRQLETLPNVFTLQLPLDPELTRGLPPSNDVPAGPDLLGIGTEVRALAEAIALKDLIPPVVVGVLGGWGAGKSFVLHLLEERLQEIRCEHVPEPVEGASEEPFPFVGHPYLIRFDAWTYAKSNLWASLMQTVFLELERQIGLEQVLQQQAGISLREETEIWRVLSRLDDEGRDRLTRTDLGRKALQVVRQFNEGQITERSLWTTLAEFRKKERVQLLQAERKAAALRRQRDEARGRLEEAVDKSIAARARDGAWKALAGHYRDLLSEKFRKRIEAEARKHGQEVPDSDDLRNAASWYWKLVLGRGPVFYAFLVFAVVALVAGHGRLPDLPWVNSNLASALSVLGAVLAAFVKGYNWLEARRSDFVQLIDKGRSQERPRDELIDEALRVAGEEAGGREAAPGPDTDQEIVSAPAVSEAAEQLANLEGELTATQAEVEAQRQRAGITARHRSLLDFVRQRLEGRYYENKLGLLHQVQSDLAELSSALLPARARRDSIDPEHDDRLKALFPRGDPRIILIIDDLDRCPPAKVVQVLETAQLLVKTPLFVVVLAMDVRYITRALEKQYDRVLVQGGEPSGLDYIEKIIQIPYRVRSVSAPVVGGFLSSQMQLEEHLLQPASNVAALDEAEHEEGEGVGASPEEAEHLEGERSDITPARPVRSELRVLPTEVLRFNEDDHRVISLCCSSIDVNPRAMKRLVNVYKLLKIIWFRQGRPDGPAEEVKRAMLALLVLAARYPEVVRQLLRHVEVVYRLGGKPVEQTLAPVLANRCRQSEATAMYPPDWARVRTALLDGKLFPQELTFRGLEESNFQLVNSFCFVSETDPDREAALLWGARFEKGRSGDGDEETGNQMDLLDGSV